MLRNELLCCMLGDWNLDPWICIVIYDQNNATNDIFDLIRLGGL